MSANPRASAFALLLLGALLLDARAAVAWGDLGHEVTALIAYRHLTATARAALDALLASDVDPLTPMDFASRSTWADKYRNAHHETAAWHYVDIEIEQPDLTAACFGFPALAAGSTASQGPARDCIVNKIDEFFLELRDRATPPAERLLALKFLIHLIGDLHQPLHVADHADRGGNCIALLPSPDGADYNLHAYWDLGAVDALGYSAPQIAARLDADIGGADLKNWTEGDSKSWALESLAVGMQDAYSLAAFPTCQSPGSIALTAEYRAQAQKDTGRQIEKAAIRMAGMLNSALGEPAGSP